MKRALRYVASAALTGAVNAIVIGLLAGPMNAAVAADTNPQDGSRRQIVKYGDLDLTRSSGVSVLYGRIKAAALTVCDEANSREVQAVLLTRKCARAALDRAVDKVNNPGLTVYHSAKLGHTGSVAQNPQ